MTHTTSEDQVYWQNWINNHDSHAGDYLVRQYMPLVNYHVQRISSGLPKSVTRDELRSYGLMGLYDALKKFEPSRDLKFDTYASFRIRGAIIDGLRKEDWMPRTLREKVKKIESVQESMEQEYMRNVSAKEVAETLGMTEEEVYDAVKESLAANVLSMDEKPAQEEGQSEPNGFTLKDDRIMSPEEELLKMELYEQLAAVIGELNEKEQLVISLFYQEELTLTEIGEVLGLSTSRISQIHSKALFRLKKILASNYK